MKRGFQSAVIAAFFAATACSSADATATGAGAETSGAGQDVTPAETTADSGAAPETASPSDVADTTADTAAAAETAGGGDVNDIKAVSDAAVDAAPANDGGGNSSDACCKDAESDAAKVCAGQSDCDNNHWCSATGCGFTQGTCQQKPADCIGEWGPTCGCDGITYDSPCHAKLAGKEIGAYFLPCVPKNCTLPCSAQTTCADCGSAGLQCIKAGMNTCVKGK